MKGQSKARGAMILLLLTGPACGKRAPAAAPELLAAAANPLKGGAGPGGGYGGAKGFVGVVVAGEWVEVEPKIEARIEQMFVKTGDQVRRGMPIARLDVQGSEHELTIARAALQDATRRLQRRVRLQKGRSGAVTAEEMDTARREVLQEQARVAKLNQARAEATVKAPFDGAVVETHLAVGAMAGPNRPLVRLLGHGEAKVRFAVPEDRAETITVGQEIKVQVGPGKPLRGRVTAINPEIDSASRMVYAAGAFDAGSETRALSTGLMARVFPAPAAAPTAETLAK